MAQQLPKKSIDGIKPIGQRRAVYLQKRRLDSQRTSFVSIQKRHHSSGVIDPMLRAHSHPRTAVKATDTVSDSITIEPTDTSLRSKELVIHLPRKWSLRAGLINVLQYVVITAVAIAAAYSTAIGQWFVLALGVYVLVTRQDSRLTYGIALFILVSVPFFQLLRQPGVANNMAVYVFELLVLGTLQALIELKWQQPDNDVKAL